MLGQSRSRKLCSDGAPVLFLPLESGLTPVSSLVPGYFTDLQLTSGNFCFSGSRCPRERTAPCVLVKPSTTNCASSRSEPLPILTGPYWRLWDSGGPAWSCKITSSWSGIDPSEDGDKGYGAFGRWALLFGAGRWDKKDVKEYLLWGEGRDEVFPVCFSRCCFSHCWKEFLLGC